MGSQTYTASTGHALPSTYYVGLSTVAISGFTSSGLGTIVEPQTTVGGVATNYARVSVTNSDGTNWNASTTGILTNKTKIDFPKSSNSATAGDWGNIYGVFFSDNATRNAGNVWWYENFPTPVPIGPATVGSYLANTGIIITWTT